MTIYDTSAILSAWSAGDPSALSDYDRAIYDSASAVLFDLLADNMTDYQRERAIYQWVVTNVSYDNDHYKDSAHVSPDSSTPYGPLVNGKGICLGYASTFQLLMDMADIECITVVGAALNSTYDHAWNQVCLDGAWYCADPTWDSGISDPDQWSFFNVTSDYMAATNHQWDYASVPESSSFS
jgi:transglutaminase/protease-like cytokinesis protein 3